MNSNFMIYLPNTIEDKDEIDLVENFFHFMSRYIYGGQRLLELKMPEINVCYALIYEGEVNNGGYTQFIMNMDNNPNSFDTALSGLKQIGAAPQIQILSEMIIWTQSNPVEIEHNWSEKFITPAILNQLDKHFYAEDVNSNKRAESSITYLTAKWLRTRSNIEFVSDEKYLSILNKR